MSVRRFLVTASPGSRMDAWAATAPISNWLEGRGPEERETWLVMCPGEHADYFLTAARQRADVTVEEIEGAGDSERYTLLAGEPGTGWKPEAPASDDAEDDYDDEYCEHDCGNEGCYDDGDDRCRHQHCWNCGGCRCPGYCDDYQTYNLRPAETGGGGDAYPAAPATEASGA